MRARSAGRDMFVLVAGALLGSCGGGGGSGGSSSSGGVTVAFTSADTVSTIENASGTIYTASARAPNGQAVSFSLRNGADAAKFAITQDGRLSFVDPPDHELPGDADGDNVYQVPLVANAGTAGGLLTVSVTVTNSREGIAVKRLRTDLGNGAAVAANSRRSGLIVIGADGRIREIDAATGATTERGNAFEPGETGRVMAVGHLNDYVIAMLDIDMRGIFARAIPLPDALWQRREEFQLATASGLAPAGTLFTAGDGLLWGAIGDPTGTFAQDGTTGFGKLFRVQAAGCGASTLNFCVWGEMFGDGIHAPAGGGAYNGQSFIMDRGADHEEEITRFNQEARPLDFGWPYREGTVAVADDAPPGINAPSIVYYRGDGAREGTGIVGGAIYGGNIADLSGRLIYGDVAGKVFAVPASYLSDGRLHQWTQIENRTEDFEPDAGAIDRPRAFVSDLSGRLFVLDDDGELFAVDPG